MKTATQCLTMPHKIVHPIHMKPKGKNLVGFEDFLCITKKNLILYKFRLNLESEVSSSNESNQFNIKNNLTDRKSIFDERDYNSDLDMDEQKIETTAQKISNFVQSKKDNCNGLKTNYFKENEIFVNRNDSTHQTMESNNHNRIELENLMNNLSNNDKNKSNIEKQKNFQIHQV